MLALTYSSLGGNGPLGVGWSLAGYSAIERCPRAYPVDNANGAIELNNEDSFCLSGMRLRLVSGMHGAANSVYGLEVDDFSIITASPTLQGSGPQSFTVVGKNGVTSEYGTTADSRVALGSNQTVLRWLLKKVRDRDGNSYTIDYSVSHGVEVPTTISWSPTVPNGSTYRYRAVLAYTDKSKAKDWVATYVAGHSVLSKQRLDSITITHGSTTLRQYVLAYEESPVTNLSRLKSVKECADSDATDCLLPTTITYQAGRALTDSPSRTVNVASGAVIRGSADFNGDDLDDLVFTAGGKWYVLFGRNGALGAPVEVAGLTGSFGIDVDYDNFLPGRRAAFVARIDTVIYMFSANDTGTSFTRTSTGLTRPFGFVPTGIAASETDLADLAWVQTGATLPPDIIMVAKNITGPSETTPRFATPTTRHTIPYLVTLEGLPMKVRPGSVQFITDRGLERRDLEADGWPEFYGTLLADFCMPQDSLNCSLTRNYLVLFSSGGLRVQPTSEWTLYDGVYPEPVDLNDDHCSDTTAAQFSDCTGTEGIGAPSGPTLWIDWDGDGRTDRVTARADGMMALERSTGTGFEPANDKPIPFFDDYRVLDFDGDGLDDLARIDGTTVRYYTRATSTAYLTQYPDLLKSVTDGYGVSYSVDYVSTAHSNLQEGALVAGLIPSAKRIVVARVTLPDGIGGAYTKSYTYVGAREDPVRGTFMGFQEQYETDSRAGVLTKTSYRQLFPHTGWAWKTEVLRSDGTLLARSQITERTQALSSTNFRQRYFPYVEKMVTETYEPQGAQSLVMRREITFGNYDFTNGNVGTVTTLVENGNSTDRWQSTTTLQYEPPVPGCLDLLSQMTTVLDRIAPNRPAITRTERYTSNVSACRHTTRVVQPDTLYELTTTFGYDSYGNIGSIQIDAQEPTVSNPAAYQPMPSRQTSVYWGSSGVAPESITNALNQTTILEYFDSGLLKRITDPNGLVSAFHYDNFGRLTRTTRPDLTHATLDYQDCGSSCLPGTQHRATVLHIERDANGAEINRQFSYLDRFDRTLVSRAPLINGNYRWNEVQYDSQGRLIRSSIPCLTTQATTRCVGAWVESQYDLLGRVTRTERPANEQEFTRELVTTLVYEGLSASITDPVGRTRVIERAVTGEVVKSTDANGYYQTFAYDSAGSLIEVREKSQAGRNDLLFSSTYDYGAAAFQKRVSDRALGSSTRWFDGLGQLRRWTDAKGQVFFADYDKLSRLVSQVTPDTARTFTWGSSTAEYNIGQLESQTSTTAGETYREDFVYDSAARLSQHRITLPGETSSPYVYDFAYNAATGQLDTLTYPTSTHSHRLILKYNVSNGILASIERVNSPATVYWSLDAAAGGLNAHGQITHDRIGPIVRSRQFDAVTGGLEQITAGPAGNPTALQNGTVNYDDFGNVFQRQNNRADLAVDLTENFEYGEPNVDRIDRLTRISLTNGTTPKTRDLRFDAFGNIDSLSTSADATPADLVPVDLSITWTPDNYPKSISAPWLSESASFAYGPDLQRWRMVYQNGSTSETTYYLGLMEKVVSGGMTEYRHYVPGPEEIVALYSRVQNGNDQLRYLLTDHLGSIDTIVNSAGARIVNASYTAYGVPRDASDWDGAASATLEDLTRQGFTFQTVLGRMGLSHMNGRVHDAISGTFISADPFIPDPLNTQSFNRYAYVYNNPLTFIDPSGFETQCRSIFDQWSCFPFVPDWDFGDLNDLVNPWIQCVKGGGCAGMYYVLYYQGKNVAPQTQSTKMDQKSVASTESARLNVPISTVSGSSVYAWADFINDAADFSAGWGDLVSFGLTARTRELWDIGSVDPSSGAYSSGEVFGFVNVALTGYGAGTRAAARASSATGWSNFSHSLFPHRWLRRFNNPIAKWLDRTGNRLNGDFVSAQLHTRMDAAAQFGLSAAWLRANPLFSPLRQWINRLPYTPGSILYGTGSAAINCTDDCE